MIFDLLEMTEIGDIGNHVGGLWIKKYGDRFYWAISDESDDVRSEEIPEELYREILKFEANRYDY